MARPPIERSVEGVPRITLFKPAGVPARELEQLQLAVDELEAIRLVDLEALSHEQAAEAMGVSRQTVGRVLERGRAKVAEALVGGKAILIGGGQYQVLPRMRCFACQGLWVADAEDPGRVTSCPRCGSTDVGACRGPGARHGCPNDRDDPRGPGCGHGGGQRRSSRRADIDRRTDESTTESEHRMSDQTSTTIRIAIPSEAPGGLEARRSGHFGRCECFTMVDVTDGTVGEVAILDNAPHTEGGCLGPVTLLAEHNVDAIVVDGIGGRPLMGFNQVGIAVHAGVGGDVQTAVSAFMQGGLPVVGLEGACQH
jgi:predicted DNA-binding protein (UPF0251 family)/predicted Fe-Mo cluster-binding NifX family protein